MMLINPYMCQNIRCDGFFAFTGLGVQTGPWLPVSSPATSAGGDVSVRRRRGAGPHLVAPARAPRRRAAQLPTLALQASHQGIPASPPLFIVSPRLAAPRLTSLACRWDRSGPAAATAATPIDSLSPSPSASTTSTVRLPRSKRLMMLLGFGLLDFAPLIPATAGDFVYNALSPMVAPDVVFGQDDEGFQPLVDYADAGNDKSCLARWDYRDPRGLFALVHELR